MSDKAFGIFLLVVMLLFVGFMVWGFISTHQSSVQNCIADAKILGIESRYNGGCQLKTPQGIWLDEKDYLMLVASVCK
jgi:hypothetical protein